MRDDFAAFILTHGRPDNIKTLHAMEKSGYTGRWYLICDDEDETLEEYIKQYGDRVLVFSKDEIAQRFDECDAGGSRGVIFYARNVAFDFAEKLGLYAFVELDDDYSEFMYRKPGEGKLKSRTIKNLDELFSRMVSWLESSEQFDCVAIAQGGDMFGGITAYEKMLRKAMNVLFCLTERRFPFVGRINEDVNTYCTLGMRGRVFATYCGAQINQMQTQSNSGGMTETYLDGGTYLKSMYTVIQCPSFVRVEEMGITHKRLHHCIDRRHGLPMILSDRYGVKG